MKKSIKRLKVEKSMYQNMLTFIKSKNIESSMIPVHYHEFDEENKQTFFPEFKIQGTIDSTQFIISISENEKNINDKYQVELNIQIDKEKHFTLLPQSNGQLGFMLDNFKPQLTIIKKLVEVKEPEAKIKETKKEETKETKTEETVS